MVFKKYAPFCYKPTWSESLSKKTWLSMNFGLVLSNLSSFLEKQN